MAAHHMHHRANGESYAHTHALREHKHGPDLGFTVHHHEPGETFPPGDLPIIDRDGVPLGPGDIVHFNWEEQT